MGYHLEVGLYYIFLQFLYHAFWAWDFNKVSKWPILPLITLSSNLNFHLQQSPFSAIISLKKSFIRNKEGLPLIPPLTNHPVYPLPETILQLEKRCVVLQSNLENAVDDAEKAYKTIHNLKNEIDFKVNKHECAIRLRRSRENSRSIFFKTLLKWSR